MTSSQRPAPAAVLFDRDGTLVHDIPLNTDPNRLRLMPTARASMRRLHDARIPVGVITNQPGIASGTITRSSVDAINARIDALLGPFTLFSVCPHGEHAGCKCRKPQPGMVLSAARTLSVSPSQIAVIGDIGSDMAAATAAGARGILVPTEHTRAEEIVAAREVAPDLSTAIELLLGSCEELS
ncbi:MAG TPA: HAD-IIIA family hydrolase [Glaciihabitans sp.]|jgi:HAD superfamily hydrolase (TIGR01662 family)|nr:HAD-IIIA family hydrolase [Glaciihabitans sp.]